MLIKRKEKNKLDRKSQLIIGGSLLIFMGITIIGIKIIPNLILDNQEEKAMEQFYVEQINNIDIDNSDIEEIETQPENQQEQSSSKINYIAVLKIPKLGIEKGLYEKGNYYNNVNRNIQILDESDMPDQEKGNVILAGHSGSGRTAYFKNLYKLVKDDVISIFYNGYEYKYRVVNYYDIEKNGTANIIRNAEKNTLTLITCRHNTNKQIIVICELIEKI